MSDDLVKQLRFTADDVCRCGTSVCLEAADHIEKLVEENGVLFAVNVRLNSRADLDSDGYVDRIEMLEAALQFYACGCTVRCADFEKNSRCGYTARAALEGKDD